MNILFVGDIFGSAGRKIVREHIGHVCKANDVELVVINAENAAGGFGVTPQIAEDLFDLGADVLTTGNHVWDKRELIDYMKSVPADSQERARRWLHAIRQRGAPAIFSASCWGNNRYWLGPDRSGMGLGCSTTTLGAGGVTFFGCAGGIAGTGLPA